MYQLKPLVKYRKFIKKVKHKTKLKPSTKKFKNVYSHKVKII